MNWDAIGAIAESIGALGVIASLIYLATQIRQNSRSVKAESVRQLLGQSSDLFLATATSAEVTAATAALVPDLTEDEHRLAMLAAAVFTNFENGYYQYLAGSLPEEIHQSYVRRIQSIMTTPWASSYWQDAKDRYTEPFQQHVNSIVDVSSNT